MKLQQDQVWAQDGVYYRIVHWERLSIVYKELRDLKKKEGTEKQVSKKEFCRLIKGAVLPTPEEVRVASGRSSGDEDAFPLG